MEKILFQIITLLKGKLIRVNCAFKILFAFLSDFHLYWQAIYFSKYKEQQFIRDMMLIGHSLEKGMFFNNKKQGWGKEKALNLCSLIKRYNEDNYRICPEYVSVVNILDAYKNDTMASKDLQLRKILNGVLSDNRTLLENGRAGIKEVNKPKPFDVNEIMRFFQTRNSVRDFSDEPLSDEEINKAMQFATMTPSACNRQSSKVYGIRNKQIIKEFLSLQLGGQGWCENASILFLITGNMSYFGGVYERHQVYIDGGMYAMNFVMGLHLVGVASCFKMFVRNPGLQRRVQKLCNIPRNETPIVCILAGHYKEKPIKDPISFRIDRNVNIVK